MRNIDEEAPFVPFAGNEPIEPANEAILEAFRRDPKTVHMSTDLPEDMYKEFGGDRIRFTPIAESSFVGAAIGLAVQLWRARMDQSRRRAVVSSHVRQEPA